LNEIGVKKIVIIIVIQNEREMTKKLVRIRGKKGSQMEGDRMVQNLLGKSTNAVILVCDSYEYIHY
jgi:hypothetical protein